MDADLQCPKNTGGLASYCRVHGAGRAAGKRKLYEGRYTKRLAAVSAATNLLSAGLSCAFLLGSSILNPQFLLYMQGLFSGDAAFLSTAFGQINLIFLAVILFALCLDTVVTAYKAFKYDSREQRK